MSSAASRGTPGRYANCCKVGHTRFEFVVDFGRAEPDGDDVDFHTRIITGPGYARAILTVLQESIGEYERFFGPIPDTDEE